MTIRYEFQNVAYPTEASMLAAIAAEWISAGGLNTAADQDRFFIENSAQELAAECIEGWGLANGGGMFGDDETIPSHMARNAYFIDDLARAFKALREERLGI